MPAPAQRKRNFLHLGHPDDHIPLFETPNVASAPASRPVLLLALALGSLLAGLAAWLGRWSHDVTPPPVALAWSLPLLLLLACIAAMPFLARHFWERCYGWIALALATLVALYYLAAFRRTGAQAIALSLAEYLSFVCLLGSLFVISGGILIHVRRAASPTVNTALLLVGALLANVLGTTGASMLLIRPYLRLNQGRIRPFHVVFFIFIVSNLGGCLTPIGDPPLFMGFLQGVPFWWVAQKCWPMWAAAVGALLAIFFLFDTLAVRRQSRPRTSAPAAVPPSAGSAVPPPADDLGPVVSIYGASNIIFLAMVIASVFLQPPWREILMVAAAVASLWTTSRRIHHENVFNFAPIREVALLFLGIFATMVPALNYLANNARHAAFLDSPGQFYFASGTLSAVLDNAPTYLTFLEAKTGKLDPLTVERLNRIVRNSWDRHPADQSPAASPAPSLPTPADLAGLTPDQQRQLAGALAALRFYHGDQVASGTLTADEIRIGLLLGDPPLEAGLIAISLGAVFFGALTYIGNGPNFMVRTIAEHAGVPCPSFFGYIARYALPILLPILILIWAIFLRV